MARRPQRGRWVDRAGCWLAASDGGISTCGSRFHGPTGDIRLNQPIVAIAADPDGTGSWLVAADGGVFAFGAELQSSPVGRGWLGSDDRVVGMEAHPSGRGDFVLTASGGAIGFGEAATVVSPPG